MPELASPNALNSAELDASSLAEPREQRRRRRRGRRGSRSGRADGDSAKPHGTQNAVPAEAPFGDAPPAVGREGSRRKRSRRGRRAGQSPQQSPQQGPVEVEWIPGEDNELIELHAQPKGHGSDAHDDRVGPPGKDSGSEFAGDLPHSGSSKRRRRSARGGRGARVGRPAPDSEREEGAVSPDESADQDLDTAAVRLKRTLKRNVILVNAADHEETRVAVVEENRIVEFQMTVKRQQSLVNDIYRGRVVNLEPAIGAAFVDFGQGRNGFLHTSDVLTAYGEPDWKLEKLLTHKVDPEEWDEGSSQPDVGVEFGVRGEPAAPEAGEHAEGDEHPSEGTMEVHAGVDNPEALLESDVEMEEVEAFSHAGEDAAPGAEHEPAAEDLLVSARAATEVAPQPKLARGREHGNARGRHNGRMQRGRPRLPITELLKKGDPVVVQVTKEAIGDKGPTLTTYISIPGRYLVLMPSMSRTGVSRKIEDEKERRRLKKILESLDVPPGMGLIVRTAGVGCTREDLRRDLEYLMLLWESFGQRLTLGRGPAELYEESDVALRTIRDLFNDATEAVIVDDPKVFKRVKDFADKLMPEESHKIQQHVGQKPLFHAHAIEQDFERIFTRRIDLPSGGSIVFDQAEALVAIDVNSGRTRSDGGFDFEQIALRTNLDAVPEIARQIRLRDLGGIIVVDFIDMMKASSRRQVERALRTAMALDRARTKLGRISQFGLLEMTRQRLGPGLSKMLFQNCSRCRGSGRTRTTESRAGAILRRLGSALTLKGFATVEVRTHPEVVEHLQRHSFSELKDMELRFEREITFVSAPDQLEDSVLRYLRQDGKEVRPGGRRKR